MPDTKPCILCGAPRPPHAYKYCEACRKRMAAENDRKNRRHYYCRNMAGKPQHGPGRPAKPKPTPQELEAAARAKSTNGWIDADSVRCEDCTYWRLLGYHTYACHYPIDTPCLRPMPPRDCYKHDGTPYRPKGE